MSEYVRITEVCPRDGWQNHPVIIPAEAKIHYVKRMIDYGAPVLDVTSFVNPKYVPQMADADDIVRGVRGYAEEKGAELFALTLNRKGVERAAALGLKQIQFVLSASEEHNQRNSRRSIAESLADMLTLREAVDSETVINLAFTCVFHSPFGDSIDLERVADIIRQAQDVGIREFGLADSSGQSDPRQTEKVLDFLCSRFEPSSFCVHLHDTHGMALANACVALNAGIRKLDSALAGMGGCPFAPGAKGNVATEDLVNMLEKMGYSTGYDLSKAISLSKAMCEEIKAEQHSSVTIASGCC